MAVSHPTDSIPVPANHKLAEREVIEGVRQGELEIDDAGRIWRIAMRHGLKSGGATLVPVARRRAEHRLPSGYLQMRRSVEGRRSYASAHRVVWQFFNGAIPPGLCVNHKNGIKSDNRPENLELVTYSENMRHAHRTGLADEFGERNPAATLSNDVVEAIRGAYGRGGVRMVDLARSYGISFQHVSAIVRGRRRPRQGGEVDDTDHREAFAARDPETGRFVGTDETLTSGAA